jgi:hypothetical protein
MATIMGHRVPVCAQVTRWSPHLLHNGCPSRLPWILQGVYTELVHAVPTRTAQDLAHCKRFCAQGVYCLIRVRGRPLLTLIVL